MGAIDSSLPSPLYSFFFLICVEMEKWRSIKAIDGCTQKAQNKFLAEIKITEIKMVPRTKS